MPGTAAIRRNAFLCPPGGQKFRESIVDASFFFKMRKLSKTKPVLKNLATAQKVKKARKMGPTVTNAGTNFTRLKREAHRLK